MYMHRECTPLIGKVSLAEYRNSDVFWNSDVSCVLFTKIIFKQA